MASHPGEAQSAETEETKEPMSPIEPVSASSTVSPRIKPLEMSPQGRYIREEKKLGSGAYKDVWRAYDTQEGIEVAWNVVKLSKIPVNERKRIKTEVSLLKTLDHPNIIKYFGSWVDRQKELIIFVTEMLSSGSLKDYINKNRIIRWAAVKRWCRQLLKGLAFLHEKGVIHRDIKCDNIFINGATGDIRIGDLGLSIHVAEDRTKIRGDTAGDGVTHAAMTCLGTPEFMAPELYEQTYDNKVDIYAFGMCALEMITQQIPFSDCAAAAQIYRKVFVLKEMPQELELVTNLHAKSMIQRCLQWNAADRPSAEELLGDQFFLDSEDNNLATIDAETPASRRAASGDVAMEDLRLDSEIEMDDDGSLTPPLGGSRDLGALLPRGSRDDMELAAMTEPASSVRQNRSRSEPPEPPKSLSQNSVPPEFEGIQTSLSSVDPSSVKIDVEAKWGDDNEIAFDLRFQVGAEGHEFATSYSPETDTPEDFVRECRDFVVATFRLPVDIIRSGQLVAQVKDAIRRLKEQNPEPTELVRVQSTGSQSPVPSEVHGEIMSPHSHRARTSSSSLALSPELEGRNEHNVFFPSDAQNQGNLAVNISQPTSAVALAELDKPSDVEQSERNSDIELDAAAESFLVKLEREYETRKREIEETHRKQAERLEQRQKTTEDEYHRKIYKIKEKQAHVQRQFETLQEQRQKRFAELDRGGHETAEPPHNVVES